MSVFFRKVWSVNVEDIELILKYTDGTYGRYDDILIGNVGEIALATWTGDDARKDVIDRFTHKRIWDPRYDFVAGPFNKKTDAKCAHSYHNYVNLLVNNVYPDVAYVQMQLIDDLNDVKNGKSVKVGVLGCAFGSDQKVFSQCQYGQRCVADDLKDLGYYLEWLRDP